MASPEQVEAVIADLAERFDRVDPTLRRALLPPRRTIEASVTDLGIKYHTWLVEGRLAPLQLGPFDGRPDIWVATTSDDLVEMATGRLRVMEAYADGRIKVDAPMLDLLRLKGMW